MAQKKWLIFIIASLSGILIFYNNCSSPGNSGNSSAASSGPILTECVSTTDMKSSPATMEDVIDLINSLPKPTTIPCLLQALDRPLKVNVTSSEFSAQPAVSKRSPRIFIFINDLVLSVVPEGASGQLLEYSLFINDQRSIKAELQFPVNASLDYAAPFDRIIDDLMPTNTKCMACHGSEVQVGSITYASAYSSTALKPSGNKVFLEELRLEYDLCISNNDTSDRCLFFRVLFSGEIQEADFPSGTGTI